MTLDSSELAFKSRRVDGLHGAPSPQSAVSWRWLDR